MTHNAPAQYGASPTDHSLETYLALFAVFYGTLFVATQPTLAVPVVAGSVVAVVTYRYLKKRLGRNQEIRRTITVPGVGTIEYRFLRS